jgi:hypothetical protein
MALLAVIGNMITTWSWFGTNQLGVGLHAYGFNNKLALGCTITWALHAALLVMGLIPWNRIWSHSRWLFGIPNERFSGKVNSIAPVLSKERRSLRVLFVIDDPDDKLRPGMFAEIGLGTGPRNAILVPADGVLHIGRADYVLTATEQANTWRVTEVQVGEPHNGDVEILDGLRDGQRVVGKGAILFKPLVVRSLQSSPLPVTEGGR